MIIAEAPVEVFDEIDSTLVEARRRAERGDLAPVWLVARRQSAGRGRRGRAWSSIDGNLMATYLCATARTPAEIALLGFAAGIAIVSAMDDSIGPGRAKLKWPNDVFIHGAKAAGIMIDSGSAPSGAWAALAFGINLAGAPEGLDQPTTSLRAQLPPDALAPDPLVFLARVRAHLEAWDARLMREGFEPLRHAWLTRAYGIGQPARVAIGAQTIEGRVLGLAANGELELETANGVRLIAAGDILLPSVEAA